MSGTKPPPCYAPVYAAALYPELAAIARSNGYALAVHGSLARDFDLVFVPWVDGPATPPEHVLAEILATFGPARLVGERGTAKPHGRRAWTVSIGHGHCACDLSFMPQQPAVSPDDTALAPTTPDVLDCNDADPE